MKKKGWILLVVFLILLIAVASAWFWRARTQLIAKNRELIEQVDTIITSSGTITEAGRRLKAEIFPESVRYIGIKFGGTDDYDFFEEYKKIDGHFSGRFLLLDTGSITFRSETGTVTLTAIFKHGRKTKNGNFADYVIGIDRSMVSD
jgi:hypothetical protein